MAANRIAEAGLKQECFGVLLAHKPGNSLHLRNDVDKAQYRVAEVIGAVVHNMQHSWHAQN